MIPPALYSLLINSRELDHGINSMYVNKLYRVVNVPADGLEHYLKVRSGGHGGIGDLL